MQWTLPFFLTLTCTVSVAKSTASAQIELIHLLPGQSQIVSEIKDPFGNIITGVLRLRQGEARGDMNRLPQTGSVRAVVDAASYDSGLGVRDQDVQENYLEIGAYPDIVFESVEIQELQQRNATTNEWLFTIRGILELHGVKKAIRVPVRLVREKSKIQVEGAVQINLDDFSITVPRLFFWRAGDNVKVQFRIVGERQP